MTNPVDNSLTQRMRSELAQFPQQRLYVGFSGGLDSSVLLHVSLELRADLTAVHVNHGLHTQADAWESRCAETCRRLGAAFVSRRVTVSGAGEAGARAARYGVFESLLGAGDLLLLGHHRGDQAETVLLRLVQGRAPLGMPRTRKLRCGGHVLRPWLTTPRAELLRFARSVGLEWIDDPSNAEVDFDRNFIRREVMPRLVERWPGAVQALAAGVQAQLARDALLAHLVAAHAGTDDAPEFLTGAAPREDQADRAGRIRLTAFPKALRVAVLRLWLNGFGEFAMADRALTEFVRQLDAKADAHPSLPLQRGVLRRYGDSVVYDA